MVVWDQGGDGGGGVEEIHLKKLFTESTGGHISWSAQVHGIRVSLGTLSTLSSPLFPPQIPPEKALPGVWGAA